MQLGLERFCSNASLRSGLKGKRVALMAHPASVNRNLVHALDAIASLPDIQLTAAFGPQHGMRGDKQDNMVESSDYVDPLHQIPVFSLYGEVRRPTQKMMDSFDVILVDLQDVGCRIYTFITTLLYLLEECAKNKKSLWVLDRPNPIGRPIEGTLLQPGWESFVGAAALPMRHGMTLGELARWFVQEKKIKVDLNVIQMGDYDPEQSPGYGWPLNELFWVNPSPNAPNLSMARCYPGSVLLEGTHLSEGRGTTRPLEVIGAPDIDFVSVLKKMESLKSDWLRGGYPRICYFEPTFHKHSKQLCQAIQFHVDSNLYQHHQFKPFRCYALALKAIRILYPDYLIWRNFHYEYEKDRLAIDLIHGGTSLREWVDDSSLTPKDFDQILIQDEKSWEERRKDFLIY